MSDHQPHLELKSLLPLRSVVVTLQCLEPVRLPFFHQASLTAYLRFIAGSPSHYDSLIRITVPEAGRITYEEGDYYRFSLIALAGSDELFDVLLRQLCQLPHSAPKTDEKLVFRDNWKLVSLQDFQTHRDISSLSELSTYDEESLASEASTWQSETAFTVRLLSPARIIKQREQRISAAGKELKGENRYIRDQDDLYAQVLSASTRNSLAALLRQRGESTQSMIDPPIATVSRAHLFWLDVFYKSQDAKTSPMGGVLGQIDFTVDQPLSLDWWCVIVLSQYLGLGQRCSFGWGRFVLQRTDGTLTCQPIFPAASILSQVKGDENLEAAWHHVTAGKDQRRLAEADDEDIDWPFESDSSDIEDSDCPTERLQAAIDKMINGHYKPPQLRGHLLPKKSGGVRPIAVAPVFDRVLQRAVQQIITPCFESIMSQQSHGYRPGRSRITASADIQTAWRQGYRWVYEGDVHDFFDSVNLTRLEERLQAVFGLVDPVSHSIIQWMKASVCFQGETIQRTQGLPQGSPLSPLMANFMLDDFDTDMRAAGFYMIRFSDDFVVLCKNPEEATKAKEWAHRSLEEHGLSLHPEKSQITAMEDGFRYLGYLFVNDMALDVGGTSPSLEANTSIPDEAAKVLAQEGGQSWLAKLGERQAQQAQSKQSLAAIVERVVEQQAIKLGTRSNSGTFVTISGSPASVSTRSRQMHVYRKDKCILQLPWNSIDCVLLLGNHQITTQAMHAALFRDIRVHFASSTGHYKGCLTHNRQSQHQSVWMQQIMTFQDSDKALYCARAVVGSRLKHLKETLRQRKMAGNIPVIDKALRDYAKATSLQSLLGYEGSATREYFARLSQLLPEAFSFQGRNRRPPKDPFNVLLSIGYTQLYALTETILHTQGLLPWQGFYHQPRGKHAVLASDLMEPFRHLVERGALTLVLRKELTAADFTTLPSGACRISDDARRTYIAYLMQRWDVKVKARGGAEAKTWLEHTRTQALSLRRFVTDGEPFTAFLLR